jgi:hypothetical protein
MTCACCTPWRPVEHRYRAGAAVFTAPNSAQPEERIAWREIHDTLAQGLAGIALQLETADALLMPASRPRIRPASSRPLQPAQPR